MADGGALRFNSGKLNLSYCPLSTQIAIASVFSVNSEENGGKYPDLNWMRGMKWSTPLNCVKRHIEAFASGESVDSESGMPHLWHALANLAMLVEYEVTFNEGDDRLPTRDIKSAGFKDMLSFYEIGLKKNLERKK